VGACAAKAGESLAGGARCCEVRWYRLRVGPGAAKFGGIAYGRGPVPGGPRAARGAVPSLRSSTFRTGHDGTSLSRHALGPASLLAHPGLPPCALRCGLPVTGPLPPAYCIVLAVGKSGFGYSLCNVLAVS